jgi:hypothetical protein
MNVLEYLEEVLLLFKDLLCNSSLLYILEVLSMLICTWCVLLVSYDILGFWFITFGFIAHVPRVFLLQASHFEIFAIICFQ